MLQRHQGHIAIVSSSLGLLSEAISLHWILPLQSCLCRAAVLEGHILQINKTLHSVTVGFTGYSAYAPTKYAVRGLADTLRNEVSSPTDLSLA